MGLKTLKDIQNLKGFHNLKTYNKELGLATINKVVEGGTELAIFPSDLKQEAIKWVKELKKHNNSSLAFEHFFNISDEDLK